MLSDAQIEARKGKLTASRVACLMNGDAAAILRLYQEFIGEAVPEDLSHVWPVRLGEVTESLQLNWFEEQNRLPVTRRGEVVVHPTIEWAACTLDGWIDDDKYPVEAKHVGGREPVEVIIDRYQPQFQWVMFVTGAKQIAVTMIFGANQPIVEFIERAEEYITEMVKRGQQFMDCVTARREPVALPAVPPPVDATRVYDMSGNNRWAANAVEWLETKANAKRCKDAEIILKALVPDDAKKAFGHDVQITRDRAGRLSLREVVL